MGALALPGALLLGAVHVLATGWLEARLFRGRSYVDLLDYATQELTRFQRMEEYVGFFVDLLPTRLRSSSALVFLTHAQDDALVLCGGSARLCLLGSMREARFLSGRSELRQLLEAAQGTISLPALLVPQAPSFSVGDAQLLALLRSAQVELLLPLVSSKQGHLIGLVALGDKETDEPYSGQERAALAALMRTAATAAENVLLFEQRAQQLEQLQETGISGRTCALRKRSPGRRPEENSARSPITRRCKNWVL